jgi:hypothetical protein
MMRDPFHGMHAAQSQKEKSASSSFLKISAGRGWPNHSRGNKRVLSSVRWEIVLKTLAF